MLQTLSMSALYGFTVIVMLILGARLVSGLTILKIKIPAIGGIENTRKLDAIFLISGIVFIWIARLPIFQFPLVHNPDEAHMSANAMRILTGGMNWDNLDPMSSGPLNSVVLAWPYLIGLDITYTTIKITGAAIISIMLVMLFLGIRRVSTIEIATICSFPLFVFYASTSNPHFIHYSSEHLPLLLLSVGIYGYLRIVGIQTVQKGSFSILLLSAFSLGLVPYAKLQAVPLATLVGLALIVRTFFLPGIMGRKKWRCVSLVICVALTPSIMFLVPLLFRGELHHFMNCYILWAMSYVGKPLNMEGFIHLARSNAFYWDVFSSSVTIFSLSLVLYSLFSNGIATSATTKKWAGGFAVLAIPVAYFCVVRPGNDFKHYLHFMLPTIALSAGVFYEIWSDAFLVRMRSVRLQGVMHILVCLAIIFAVIPAGKADIKNNPVFAENGVVMSGLNFKSPRLLQWLGTKDTDSILIWGWMPQWYLDTGMTPATSETTTENLIAPRLLPNYFIDRLIHDLNKSQPDFILDAVTPDSFTFNNPDTQSISTFGAFSEIIKDSFVRVSSDDPKGVCPRLYVRKERLAALQRYPIPISRISVSAQYNDNSGPEHLDDGDVFESAHIFGFSGCCINYWLLPNASTGNVILDFANSKIGSISILNTRNSFYDYRASERVRILFLLGETILHQHELTLNRYPYWTSYRLTEPISAVNSVRIEVLSFIGAGAGLNEIKVYRE